MYLIKDNQTINVKPLFDTLALDAKWGKQEIKPPAVPMRSVVFTMELQYEDGRQIEETFRKVEGAPIVMDGLDKGGDRISVAVYDCDPIMEAFAEKYIA